MALGGSGGCIPVYVLPDNMLHSAGGMLPYSSWLDYCSLAYITLESTARTDAGAIIQVSSRHLSPAYALILRLLSIPLSAPYQLLCPLSVSPNGSLATAFASRHRPHCQ